MYITPLSLSNTYSLQGINSNGANSNGSKTEVSFRDLLEQAVDMVNQSEARDRQGSLELLTRQETDLHTVLINAEKADITLQYALQIRNKILDAYNQIMQMQI